MKFRAGFSLVEIAVGMALAGTLFLGAMKAVEAISKASKSAGASGNVVVLKNQIQSLLSSPAACFAALKDSANGTPKFNPNTVLAANYTAAQLTTYKTTNTLSKISLGSLTLATDGQESGGVPIILTDLKELDSTLRTSVTVGGVAAKRVIASLDIIYQALPGVQGSNKTLQFPISIDINDTATSAKYTLLACSMMSGGAGGAGGSIITGTHTCPACTFRNPTACIGTVVTDSRCSKIITLPVGGSYTLLVTATYFACEDSETKLQVDGSTIASFNGANYDSQGCDQNVIMGRITGVAAGSHTFLISAAVGVHDPMNFSYQWIAIPE